MKQKLFYLGAIIITLFLTTAGVYSYWFFSKITVKSSPTTYEISALSLSLSPTPDPLKPLNLVLLGYGGADHPGGLLSDTIIAVHINHRQQKTYLISIPRDLWVSLPVTEAGLNTKINAAFAIGNDDRRYPDKPDRYRGEAGGGNLAKDLVSQVTNLPIEYFIAIDFRGFESIIDKLGGVNVLVPYSFDDYYYPLKGSEEDLCDKSVEEIESLTATLSGHLLEHMFTCRFEPLHFDRGTQYLDGSTALKFVRSRHSNVNGGDFGRALRQQALLIAIKEKLTGPAFVTKLIPLLNELAYHLRTDATIDVITDLALKRYDLISITLNEDNVLTHSVSSDGQYILTPQDTHQLGWTSIHEYLEIMLSGDSI
jgi:polyisoprenyl-teichoic acid--peptidoglycan teichoic acid transferase